MSSDPGSYAIAANINELPGQASLDHIDYVEVTSLILNATGLAVVFEGSMSLEATIEFGDDGDEQSLNFLGHFAGYFDVNGIFLDSAFVDTRSK